MKLTDEQIEEIRKATVDQFLLALKADGHAKQDPVTFARAIESEVLRLNGITGDGRGETWTIIAPDGTRFTGETPLKAAMPASKYRIENDPVAQAKFLQAIETIRQEGKKEAEQCIRDYGTLDCPHCGGSGHIADAVANGHPPPQQQQAAPVAVPDARTYCAMQSPGWAVSRDWEAGWNACRAFLSAAPKPQEPGA